MTYLLCDKGNVVVISKGNAVVMPGVGVLEKHKGGCKIDAEHHQVGDEAAAPHNL
jgi:hypothetical protein